MTGPDCAVLGQATIARYAAGCLDGAAAWSVEAHLPGCAACRAVLAARSDAARLERNFAVVLARTGLPGHGPLRRSLRRCGVPGYVIDVLGATPSLRRSWLAGVLLVLAIIVGASQLAVGLGRPPGLALAVGRPDWTVLVPFLVITPLLPLAAVAAAFSAVLDPGWQLTAAAPVSALWLLSVRSAAVVTTTLLPVALAALLLPGPLWLALALLLPALAICAAAIALSTIIPPHAAVGSAALSWMALVIAVAVAAGSPAGVFGPAGQFSAVAVLIAGVALIALRRSTIDYGWTR